LGQGRGLGRKIGHQYVLCTRDTAVKNAATCSEERGYAGLLTLRAVNVY
jgi:hypothetical protein